MSETSPLENSRTETAAIGWQGALDEVDTEHDLVSVTRDFLATWTPEEIVKLPKPLRPWKIVDADDITSYAIQLAQDDESGDAEAVKLKQRMSAFFSDASLRLSQILARNKDLLS